MHDALEARAARWQSVAFRIAFVNPRNADKCDDRTGRLPDLPGCVRRGAGLVFPASMVRIVLVAVLSLLLVGMQREALLHEVDHLRAKVVLGHDKALQKSAGGECGECALLASGSTAVPPEPTADLLASCGESQDASFATIPLAASRPAPYRSRAPPIVL